MSIKVADEVWLATSLLHRENPGREDFSVGEIVARARKEKLAGGYRPGLQIHVSNHCVATKPPNPARHRMLSETGRGRRRLFRPGDKFHRDRKQGKTHPAVEDIPPKYRHLVDWYEHNYANGNNDEGPLPQGGRISDIVNTLRGISSSDIKKMEAAIEEHCGVGGIDLLPPPSKMADLLNFAGMISSSDLKKMDAAIEESSETDPLPPGAKMADVLKFVGRISSSDRKKMEAAIAEHCGRVNRDAW